ncbi:MAG TPA: hypothetical protein VHV08_01040 [Pirellulales bacterium]|nr:hypothetical protein [Pirellulales bacterium]
MIRWLRKCLLMSLAVVVVHGPGVTGGTLPDGFTDKYQPAVDKLQSLYSHATVNGSVKRDFPRTGESYEQRYLFRAAGPKIRLDVSTISSRKGGPPVGTVEQYLATPDASYYGVGLYEAPHIDTSKELTYAEARSRIAAAFPIDQPFALGSSTVLDVLRGSQVNVESVKKLTHKGEKFVKIVFDQSTGNKDKPETAQSYIILSPSEGWAVREFSKTTGQGNDQLIVRGKISYGDTRDGVPIVDKIETWRYEGPERVCVLHEVVAVSRFVYGDPSSYTFTADAFK